MTSDSKLISICMPYYDRMEYLNLTLAQFEKCGYFDKDFPYALELSICDDGSIKEPIPKEFLQDKYPHIQVTLTWLPKKDHWSNPCLPLDLAVRQSHGEYILLQSPETIHRVPILEEMVTRIKAENDIVLCPVQSQEPQTGKYRWRCHPTRSHKLWFCQMMTRTMYEKSGGQDLRFRDGLGRDDLAFEIRLERVGANWIYLPDEMFAFHKWHEKQYQIGTPDALKNRARMKKYYNDDSPCPAPKVERNDPSYTRDLHTLF